MVYNRQNRKYYKYITNGKLGFSSVAYKTPILALVNEKSTFVNISENILKIKINFSLRKEKSVNWLYIPLWD